MEISEGKTAHLHDKEENENKDMRESDMNSLQVGTHT